MSEEKDLHNWDSEEMNNEIIQKNFDLEMKVYRLHEENRFQAIKKLMNEYRKNYIKKINSRNGNDFEKYREICRELKINIIKNKYFIEILCYPSLNMSDDKFNQIIELLGKYKFIDFTKYYYKSFWIILWLKIKRIANKLIK